MVSMRRAHTGAATGGRGVADVIIGDAFVTWADTRGSATPLDAIRVMLVADVVGRIIEHLLSGQAFLVVLGDDERTNARLSAAAAQMAIREPTTWLTSNDGMPASLGRGVDMAVVTASPRDDARRLMAAPERLLRVGAVSSPEHTSVDLLNAWDPSAVRLALLRIPFHEEARLSLARLHRAGETLQRWRYKVADWADLPSAPASSALLETARNRLVTDLDAGSVLTLLHRLEMAHDVPGGSKFESFMYLDRILAVDLARLIGKRRA
jgi:hypothetical protein